MSPKFLGIEIAYNVSVVFLFFDYILPVVYRMVDLESRA